MNERAIYGDFQTPVALARRMIAWLAARAEAPRAIVEPTVGDGSVLGAALERHPGALGLGFDVSAEHLAVARRTLAHHGEDVRLAEADVFAHDFGALASTLPDPCWIVGNPPWVTSAAMPRLGGGNLPSKQAQPRARGLDARTGRANFDVAEWILARLVDAFRGKEATFGFLVKTQVARRLLLWADASGAPLHDAAIVRIDAAAEFGAQVEACFFAFRLHARGAPERYDADVFAGFDARAPEGRLGVRAGALVADVAAFDRIAGFVGASSVVFRSGLKHDASAVFELVHDGEAWRNGRGELVAVEEELLFPLRKSRDLARGEAPRRAILVPQRALGDDTASLEASAPRAWAYLVSRGAELDARRSSIYRGRPRFSIFGVGPYCFAPYKVAVAGLAKAARFVVVPPVEGRPTMLDDTAYYVPCPDAESAEALASVLGSPLAQAVIAPLVFAGAKRPITKELLSRIEVARIAERLVEEGVIAPEAREALRRLEAR